MLYGALDGAQLGASAAFGAWHACRPREGHASRRHGEIEIEPHAVDAVGWMGVCRRLRPSRPKPVQSKPSSIAGSRDNVRQRAARALAPRFSARPSLLSGSRSADSLGGGTARSRLGPRAIHGRGAQEINAASLDTSNLVCRLIDRSPLSGRQDSHGALAYHGGCPNQTRRYGSGEIAAQAASTTRTEG
jgi:hypothetical protein